MLIDHGTLVLVADGKRFMLLRNAGTAQGPSLQFEGGGEQSNPPTREQGVDRPGRSFSSTGSRRSAMEQTDFHRQEEERFAGDIAGMLENLASNGDFDKLVVIAPPQTLAELRRNYGREVTGRLVREFDKDLTRMPVAGIADYLAAA